MWRQQLKRKSKNVDKFGDIRTFPCINFTKYYFAVVFNTQDVKKSGLRNQKNKIRKKESKVCLVILGAILLTHIHRKSRL